MTQSLAVRQTEVMYVLRAKVRPAVFSGNDGFSGPEKCPAKEKGERERSQ